MRSLLVALILPLALPWRMAPQEAPKKGDKIYVDACFEDVCLPLMIGNARWMRPGLVNCSLLLVKDAKPDKLNWVVEGVYVKTKTFRLDGPWLPRIHKTLGDCEVRLRGRGDEAIVKRNGLTFTITEVPPDQGRR